MATQNTQKPFDVYYNAADGFVTMTWRGYATSQEFRQGSEMMLKLLTNNHVNKVLADIQEMLIIGRDDQDWLETEFLPRAITAGFKAIAFVKPGNHFGRVTVQTVSDKIDQEKLTIRFCDTIDEARQWISSC
ncbi:MAG: hypothetical protein JWO03_1023 [Bacteroidetes bacterium]|nr:hypothetical protein [Bacteroidota bacterium]